MRLEQNSYSVAEIRDMLSRRELVVNRNYQRGSQLWPSSARSYFIDTVLTGFPFPKLYFFEQLDRKTKKIVREIVDGQQRITSIIDFLNDKYRLTSVSENYAGKLFSELDPEIQDSFLMAPVPADIIRSASEAEILEMFRRMNAYTLPLNEAEKRHSIYMGAFKWFVNSVVDKISPTILAYNILTNRQIVRMEDSELVADMVLAFEEGIISTSNAKLNKLYERFDKQFDKGELYGRYFDEAFSFITTHLGELRGSFLFKPYVIHSLVCALIHNKYGLPDGEAKLGLAPIGSFSTDPNQACRQLQSLAMAHEGKDLDGPYREYVLSCQATTREKPRITRVAMLAKALRCEL